MALRQLMITRKLEALGGELSTLKSEAESLKEKRSAMDVREAEIAATVEELDAKEDATDEEKAAVEEEADKFEAENKELTDAETKNAERTKALQDQIDNLNKELEELNARAKAPADNPEKKSGKDDVKMINRSFFGMTAETRDAFLARDDVKGFLTTVREAYTQKRAINGAGLLIPQVMLPILRQVTGEASKLMKHVDARRIPGTGRQNIMGDIPEAVWTEMCAKINELSLTFNNVEVDGYKVGGFIAVCNAILEDADDVDLASEVLTAIGKAIGYALDKAILFGTGTKMPLGIATRLSQTQAPSDYPTTARAWTDLHTSNIVTIASSKEGAALYKELVKASGKTRNKYATGTRFWVMNEVTHTNLVAEALTINAAGAIVTGQSNTMPIIGGAIETLDFIPDNVIIGGYGASYILAERAGTKLEQSEHVRFLDDQTVFRGTARYDGKPAIPESFVVIGLGAAPSFSGITFAADLANA